MPSEITMPQLSDTMTEGTVVKWHVREGEPIRAGQEIADVETDKATMPMEAYEGGTMAYIAAPEGTRLKVGALLAVVATGGEDAAEVRRQYASGGRKEAKEPAGEKPAVAVPTPPPQPPGTPPVPVRDIRPARPAAAHAKPSTTYNFDIVVIGGGPAGYAAAIRAGQLKKRVLCIENENLGGTCLNWGCIPTKSLLEDGAFVRRLRTEGPDRGLAIDGLKVDFGRMIARSRAIANKLSNGIGHLFRKYEVKYEEGTGQILGPHKVGVSGRSGTREITADHIIIAVGSRPAELSGAPFDGQRIIASREAMTLEAQPRRLAIIGGGAIGCEFADFYDAVGTEVTIIEMLPHLLPIEDEDVSVLLERSFAKRGIRVHVGTRTEKVEKTKDGVKLTLSGKQSGELEADLVLVAVGVSANTGKLLGKDLKLELERGRVRVDPEYRTNLENVWAVGDCISIAWPEGHPNAGIRHPDLAHVAHHEAVICVDRICGVGEHEIDYRFIPACTYTHPQVASMGLTEKRLREQKRDIRIGKFPFSASGRALAAGEPEGFAKLIFDARYGELLGAHLIGDNVTEMLSELVLARRLEATEEEILLAMHPHPTMSEAVMEAAGIAAGRAIHF